LNITLGTLRKTSADYSEERAPAMNFFRAPRGGS